jgi:hypothetical protein
MSEQPTTNAIPTDIEAEREQVTLPDEWAVVIIDDEEYNANPGTFVSLGDEEDAAYVEEFASGKLSAYAVMIVERDDEGRVPARIWGDSVLASLWGVDVNIDEHGTQDGRYDSLDQITDDYLRSVAADLISEAQERVETEKPVFTRAQVRTLLKVFQARAEAASDCSGPLADNQWAVATNDEHENWAAYNAHSSDADVVQELLDGKR